MKKRLALLLAGCLALQSVSGGAAAHGEEAVPDGGVVLSEESAQAADDVVLSEEAAEGESFLPDAKPLPEQVPAQEEQPDETIILEDPDGTWVQEDPRESETGGLDGAEEFVESEVQLVDDMSFLAGGDTAFSGSRIEVKVVSALPFHPADGTKVTVAAGGQEKTVVLSSDHTSGTAGFDLAPGTYTVKLTAEHFADYVQEGITVGESQIARIVVNTGRTAAEEGAKSQAGRMQLGDVNGDGALTRSDLDHILRAIRDPEDSHGDLTCDGRKDLADLQFAVQSFQEGGQASTVELLTVAKEMSAEEGTTVTGAENLLSDTGTTSLKPARQDSPISAENPVAMSFELPENTALGGMTIQTPTAADEANSSRKSSDITSATVEYTYEENGKEYKGVIAVEDPAARAKAAEPETQPGPEAKAVPSRSVMSLMTLAAGIDILAVEQVDGDASGGEEPAGDVQEEQDGILIEQEALQGGEALTPPEDAQQFAETDVQQPVEPDAAGAMPEQVAGGDCKVEPDGSIVLDFGRQVAVKRVTIRITGTRKNAALVDIARVEFVNDMESRIPAPELNIPEIRTPVGVGNEEIDVAWSAQTNVTGYEVSIEGPVKKKDGTQKQSVRVSGTQHKFVSINDLSLKNFQEYTIRVRSVNGEWASEWSKPVTARPVPEAKPAKVDNVTLTGGYRSIRVNWKDMDDANGYMVYYKAVEEEEFVPAVEGFVPDDRTGAGKIDAVDCTITSLKDNTEYEVYVVGWNELGWGEPSNHMRAFTQSGTVPELPKYELINTSNGPGVLSAHIESILCGTHGGQKMVASALDEAKSSERPTFGGETARDTQWALGVADDDYASYWTKYDWDDGVAYYVGLTKGLTVTLDEEYEMNYLTFTAADLIGTLENARITYWNSTTGKSGEQVGATLLRKMDKNNNPYYIVRFNEVIRARSIQLCLGRGYGHIDMKVAEIHLHRADGLYRDIMKLFADEMHTTLADGVTEEAIRALEARLEETDANGEKHPLYDSLVLELQAARELLHLQLDEAIEVDNRITASRDGHLGFGGLNAWQPLGRAAAAGETLIVYVGHNTKSIGEYSRLRLIFTQYHAESNGLMQTSSILKVGRNEITVPLLSRQAGVEHGGQLYVAYEGNDAFDRYGIRINGGTRIPMLNLYRKTEEEKDAAIRKYVEELGTYVASLEEAHAQKHEASSNQNVACAYDERNCFLNATDIMMEHMMYSVPAKQVWNALAGDKAASLKASMQAMEDAMALFYHHKGLSNKEGAGSKNALPAQHLNIRYMRMFAGVFMYASGNHIGIEYPETSIAGGATTMDGFGWGIAHEIGHDINQSCYAIAEITNNYFAQLLTMAVKGTRFTYENIYKKVTSGAVGRDANVGTQLGLYWQLHLAFDNQKDDRHIYDTYRDQFENLFFARVDTYARDPGQAPKKGLALGSDVDQNLMRLACAAANQNILPFFERWGMQPNADTIAYATLYGEPTQKAYYYVTDAARNYRVDHPEQTGAVAGRDVVSGASVSADGGRVTVTVNSTENTGVILGYEIIRNTYANGEKISEIAGFQPAEADGSASFTETVASINNRVMTYEVKAVDQYLNYSNTAQAGSVKISTGGALDKSGWTVTTTMTSDDDVPKARDEEDPDSGYHSGDPQSVAPETVHSIDRIIDGGAGVYTGKSSGSAEIVVDMHRTEEVTSLRYMGGDLPSVTISVSEDGREWTCVKRDYPGCTGAASGYVTVWFDSVLEEHRDSWIGTYSARYVRLEVGGTQTVQISEIEICGPSGDNVEFIKEDGKPAIGILSEDLKYGKEEKDVIPSGSLIFTGTYQGNPAYNVVVVYDQDGNVIGAKGGEVNAEQVIFAKVPENGNLGNTSDGRWVYYVRPENWDDTSIKDVSGVRAELYRVDDAKTLAGERVVSDTAVEQMPRPLQHISLSGVAMPGAES